MDRVGHLRVIPLLLSLGDCDDSTAWRGQDGVVPALGRHPSTKTKRHQISQHKDSQHESGNVEHYILNFSFPYIKGWFLPNITQLLIFLVI